MVCNKYDFKNSYPSIITCCRLDAELEGEFSSSAEESDKDESGNSSSDVTTENSTQPTEESADSGIQTAVL